MNLCLECPDHIRGTCCTATKTIGSITFSERCNFLTEEGWCGIYEDRHKINEFCLTAKQMIKDGLCPEGCLYAS